MSPVWAPAHLLNAANAGAASDLPSQTALKSATIFLLRTPGGCWGSVGVPTPSVVLPLFEFPADTICPPFELDQPVAFPNTVDCETLSVPPVEFRPVPLLTIVEFATRTTEF